MHRPPDPFAASEQCCVRHVEGNDWTTPGGMIEPYETPSNAAVREMWEETGLYVELTHVIGVFGGEILSSTYLCIGVSAIAAASPRTDWNTFRAGSMKTSSAASKLWKRLITIFSINGSRNGATLSSSRCLK